MRLFLQYLKGYQKMIRMLAVFSIVFVVSFKLYHLPIEAVLYPTVLCIGIGGIYVLWDFMKLKHQHEVLQQIQTFTDIVEDGFPLDETIKETDYHQIIRLMKAEHHAYCCETEKKYADMIGYYTVWAHQIKTPIASMRLHLQNEDSVFARKMTADLCRIEQYVEMVLTFLRLNTESTDYVFRETDLDKIVRTAVKKFSSEFISRKLRLVYEPLNTKVVTDEKWLSFVIEQVLSNALKYTPSGMLSISLVDDRILRIQDTGIGIAPEDLPRIFENGYTGYNGRTDHKASGIGLYLCKQICSNLGHQISVSSTVGEGTVVEIDLFRERLHVE